MAKKDYILKQETKKNDVVLIATAYYACDESEMAEIVPLLEGKVTVFTEDASLSSADDKSTTVTNSTDIDQVIMSHSQDKTAYFGAYGKPLRFDSSKSATEIANMFKAHKPFINKTAEKPEKVLVKLAVAGGEVASV